MPASGHAKLLRDVRITQDETPIGGVVLKHQQGMNEAWCIATNLADLGAAEIVSRYARRFTIEETFRDILDNHFGMGLSATNIRSADRRDRLLFISAIAQALLTQLGAAVEACGLDRILKSNTVKTRTMSLFNQGSYWYRAIPNMREDRLRPLMEAPPNGRCTHTPAGALPHPVEQPRAYAASCGRTPSYFARQASLGASRVGPSSTDPHTESIVGDHQRLRDHDLCTFDQRSRPHEGRFSRTDRTRGMRSPGTRAT